MTKAELKEFLDAKVLEYNHPKFLEDDPLQIPHVFTQKEDIEISAFLTATIAWGNRKSIINNANKLMGLMGNVPYDFIMNYSEDDLEHLSSFVHRTFNGIDLAYFVSSLQHIYKNHGGLETVFSENQTKDSMQPAISKFKELFFELPHQNRTQKHVSDPNKGSAAKRINMFLRWMVRDNSTGVDFGLWKGIDSAKLSCPLDVHSGNVARKLKLLNRKQNDAKALQELDKNLRKLDATDPVKYDFALFGLGVFEKF
ncbi:MAG: TIGR02757 family protein [Bacteroidota bacterium]|uniref:TIGR02757 family protein n=1 Tax=Flagellimonas profundi TaxID=2915620 RepID=A0ABS3FCH6_9FLAO|nr:TIGR02757 family protein [Allomuricauda profundi]MBO0340864.1 TIGR02757 family protein [Allomuricauda profundi]MEC7771968.1 TIGR02757 family protein [Bacteroidota bacterium]